MNKPPRKVNRSVGVKKLNRMSVRMAIMSERNRHIVLICSYIKVFVRSLQTKYGFGD